MRSMNAEAVLKHRVRNEQTSGQKKLPSKGVLIFYFFPAHMQIFRPIGQSFAESNDVVSLSASFRHDWQQVTQSTSIITVMAFSTITPITGPTLAGGSSRRILCINWFQISFFDILYEIGCQETTSACLNITRSTTVKRYMLWKLRRNGGVWKSTWL